MNTKRTDRATDQKRGDKDKNIKKTIFFSLIQRKKFFWQTWNSWEGWGGEKCQVVKSFKSEY